MNNTKHTKEQIRERIQQKKILFDGAFGTYYGGKYDTRQLPELANLEAPERVKEIHREYLEAGAQILRTNTFAANSFCMDIPRKQIGETLRSGLRLAREAVAEWREATGETKEIYIAADIGQIPGEAMAQKDALSREYEEICNIFLEEGADFFVFETFSEMEELLPAIKMIGEQAFITVQFSVNQFGYSNAGLSARKLLQRAGEAKEIDAVGFNCGVGPSHMHRILQILEKPEGKLLTALPNAGYPQMVTGRMLFTGDNKDYFVDRMQQMTALGVDMAGGCCGTTPAHIAALCAELDALPQQTEAAPAAKLSTGAAPAVEKDDAFLRKLNAGEKVIAIELDSPRVADLSGYLDGARRLQAAGADLLTIADCPIAQARMDSSLVACRVHRELGMCALPHMTCRDRNLNATKALLLGLYAEGVREVLAITGDPIPTAERDEVKNVYQFNSRKLAQYIVSLAGEGREMPSPLTVFGALNLNARNFEVELRRAAEKLENGMSGFLTQPVLSAQAVENLKKTRETLGERAKILAGILPVVSQRNAIFMENEVNGIHVDDAIIQRFEGLDRAAGEELGLEVSVQAAKAAAPYADGFYLMTPFNRVALMERLIARLRTEVTG